MGDYRPQGELVVGGLPPVAAAKVAGEVLSARRDPGTARWTILVGIDVDVLLDDGRRIEAHDIVKIRGGHRRS